VYKICDIRGAEGTIGAVAEIIVGTAEGVDDKGVKNGLLSFRNRCNLL
jgi:hypothetical protein